MEVTEVVGVVERGRGRGREREDKVWPLALPKKKYLILTIDVCVCGGCDEEVGYVLPS